MEYTSVGQFLKARREGADLSLWEANHRLGFAVDEYEGEQLWFPLSEKRMRPVKNVYQLSDEEYDAFIRLVREQQKSLPEGLKTYVQNTIMNSPEIIEAIYRAKQLGAASEDWKLFADLLECKDDPLLDLKLFYTEIESHSVEHRGFYCDTGNSSPALVYQISVEGELAFEILNRYALYSLAEEFRTESALPLLRLVCYPETEEEKLFVVLRQKRFEVPVSEEDKRTLYKLKCSYADTLDKRPESICSLDKFLVEHEHDFCPVKKQSKQECFDR